MAEEKKDGKQPAKKTTKKTVVSVEFIKSPTGHFNLGYSVGQTAKLPKDQADILIDNGYAKKI